MATASGAPNGRKLRWWRVAGYALTTVAAITGLLTVAWPGVLLAHVHPLAAAGYAAAIGCLGVAAWVGARRRRGRERAAQSWAAVHGWQYGGVASAVPGFGVGVLRTVLDGVEVTSCDAIASPDLVAGSPRTSRHVVAARVAADLPTLVLVPESVPRPVGAPALSPDVQFESADFNARWRVHCADGAFAHAFCHPLVMERLMRPDAAGVSVLVDGRDVIVHAPGNQVLDAIGARAALAVDLVHLVPAYLLEQHPPRTRRRRRRRSEHSRVGAFLAIVLWGAWLALLVAIGRAGAVDLAVAVGLPSLLLPLAVLVLVARRRRAAERRSSQRHGMPISRT